MTKKFKLTTNTKISFGRKLFQIQALVTFSDFYGEVKEGELGGFLEKEENLTQDLSGGWVSGGEVSGTALVSGGRVSGGRVSGTALVSGGRVSGGRVSGGRVSGTALVSGGRVSGGWVSGTALVSGDEESIKKDLIGEVLKLPNELEALRDALVFGKIDGSTYSTEGCSCLAGTIAKNRNIETIESGCEIEENGNKFQVNSESPRERWFMGIKEGDNPENSYMAKRAHEWICEAISMRDHIRETSKKVAA